MENMRLVLRLTMDRPWTEEQCSDVQTKLTALIGGWIDDGNFMFDDWVEEDQTVVSVAFHPLDIPTPEDGFKARTLGFEEHENPFETGTPEHVTWKKSWDQAIWKSW